MNIGADRQVEVAEAPVGKLYTCKQQARIMREIREIHGESAKNMTKSEFVKEMRLVGRAIYGK